MMEIKTSWDIYVEVLEDFRLTNKNLIDVGNRAKGIKWARVDEIKEFIKSDTVGDMIIDCCVGILSIDEVQDKIINELSQSNSKRDDKNG